MQNFDLHQIKTDSSMISLTTHEGEIQVSYNLGLFVIVLELLLAEIWEGSDFVSVNYFHAIQVSRAPTISQPAHLDLT